LEGYDLRITFNGIVYYHRSMHAKELYKLVYKYQNKLNTIGNLLTQGIFVSFNEGFLENYGVAFGFGLIKFYCRAVKYPENG
jgi:hypothetical protein